MDFLKKAFLVTFPACYQQPNVFLNGNKEGCSDREERAFK
jgi:hypothetical protein